MNLDDYGVLYGEALSLTRIAVPEATLLYRVAGEVLDMAAAYHSDGFAFLRAGDHVNALAAFAYGLGWLDAGSRLGLLEPAIAHSPEAVDAIIPEQQNIRLDEKTHRYRRMLVQPSEGSGRRRTRQARFMGGRKSSVRRRVPGMQMA